MRRSAIMLAVLTLSSVPVLVIALAPRKLSGSGDKAVITSSIDRVNYPSGRYPKIAMPGGGFAEIKSLLNSQRPMHFGDYIWDEAGVPTGPVWVRVDLSRQLLSVFRGGDEIGSTVILFGTDGKPTPTGSFPVLAKAETHISSLYDAEMPFMLRLTGDGVAIHASKVREGSATHGCIGVPYDFARLLYNQIKRGDRVAIMAT